MWADFGGRSNIYEYRTKSLTWLRSNSRINHRVVAEVAVSREAIMEEGETEAGVGHEELVEEEEVEVESELCPPANI